MTFLTSRIKALAFLGKTPREIERRLGMEPYTIHKCYHKELMEGYAKREARGEDAFGTEETRKILLGLYREDPELVIKFKKAVWYRLGHSKQTMKGATA